MPDLESKLEVLISKKQKKDEAFEKIEMVVREKTESLRKEKEKINQKKNPFENHSR